MKKVLFLIFVSFFMISNVNALKIVSLGDSIPNGHLLEDTSRSYDNRIAETLNAEFYEYSVPGFITDDILKSLDIEEVKENVLDADIIFINTGTGDLLDLTDNLDFKKFDLSGENADLSGFKDYLVSSVVNDMKPKVSEVLDVFSNKFMAVINKIKSYNPNVKIYVNNIYNPFFNISIPLVLDLSEVQNTIDEAIKTFNDFLKSNDGYQVIDVYSALRNNDYLNIDPLKGSFDPHPNELGNDVLYELYLKELCYKVTYDGKDYYILKGDSFNIEPKEKEGYTFVKWNYDLNKIDKDIELKEVYKKNINYLYFIIPGFVLLLVVVIIIIKKKK